MSDIEAPQHGWIEELKEAEASAKTDRSPTAQLRVATANYKLRSWKDAKAATTVGLEIDPSATEKKRKITEMADVIDTESMNNPIRDQEALGVLGTPGLVYDTYLMASPDTVYTNLNVLQYAAATGNIPLLEMAIARGASLDLPVVNNKIAPGIPSEFPMPMAPAPSGTTALLLACLSMALTETATQNDPNYQSIMPAEMLAIVDGASECAVRLVYLGADMNVRLKLPAVQGDAPFDPSKVLTDPLWVLFIMNLDGKSCRELAELSGRQALIDAMEQMKESKNAIRLTQCRCESRLQWNECHGAPITGQSPLYIRRDDDHVDWRYSPSAFCPCTLTDKKHFDCCWNSSHPFYHNDVTGVLYRCPTVMADK